jgi:hypothetical protein
MSENSTQKTILKTGFGEATEKTVTTTTTYDSGTLGVLAFLGGGGTTAALMLAKFSALKGVAGDSLETSFDKLSGSEQGIIVIAALLAGYICSKTADRLLGDKEVVVTETCEKNDAPSVDGP